jgi:predicted dehydrogenase
MLRVAILGAGFMGGTHARAFHAHPQASVATIYAHSDRRAGPLADEVGAAWTDDLARAVTDPGIDAVSICLPTPDHRFAAEVALDAGKHVLLEKPIALTEEDADALVARAAATDRVVMIGHVLRFWPGYVAVANLADSGQLGELRSAVAARRQPFPAWTTLLTNSEMTGGAVVDMLVHDFDLLNWLFGLPATVTARGQRNPRSGGWDQVQVLLGYGDGRSAVVDGGMTMPDSYPFTSELHLLGSGGAAEYRYRAGGAEVGSGGDRDEVWVYPGTGHASELHVAPADPYEAEIGYFIECARAGRPAERATPAAARDALRVALAAARSLDAGGATVTLD